MFKKLPWMVGRVESVIVLATKKVTTYCSQGEREVGGRFMTGYIYELWRTMAWDCVWIKRNCYCPMVALSQSHE